ncbi:helix-turn-helix transcriptional regulator [Streptomyces sp. FL07-04A]|uniref:helix-turn-helix domain-containing protein n=1 Tax=Streptomyces sp. FL07-04A TaxID=3028658 RepID=UPI0029A15D35|nr:helix-turn-helix transcriptional regulator [Streptomyces sp. FL07-04A]MDX3578658.1 helix-turn-helix transcriptional regulator [Streptomyces sp. FL07-04A]
MASTPSPRWAPLPIGLGASLAAARIEAGYSGRALARTVGRSHAWLRGLEAGERPPSRTMAGRISAVLHLDPWADAVLQAVAVDDAELRARPGSRRAATGQDAAAVSAGE